MDFQTGERVNLNFDTGEVEKTDQEPNHGLSFPTFMGDILERDSSPANPPAAPSLKSNVNGFPTHKKRVPRVSAFKQQRAAKEKQEAAAALQKQDAPKPGFDMYEEKRTIDEENRRKLASMSDREIEQERQDLLSSLSPALIQKLLLRSNMNDGSNERDLYPEEEKQMQEQIGKVKPEEDEAIKSQKKVQFAPQELSNKENALSQQEPTTTPTVHHQQSATDTINLAADTATPSTNTPTDTSDSIHFPQPPQPPDLDPNDPNFLKNLHTKYFPNLPYNPNELSWMAPIDPSDKTSPYHPSQTALNPSELRFDFKGNLLAPSVAREISTDKGLHHHADAPEAAGYTIPELAVTARSQVAAQRCMAYQTLGRILFRLGQGEFGVERARQETDGPVHVAADPGASGDEDDDEDVGSAMARGLWSCIEEGQVIETLTEEANRTKGHLTARTFAQEALWNWRRGGGRKRQAV